MENNIEKIKEDVLSLTRDRMLLYSNSEVRVWESEELFEKFVLEIKKRDKSDLPDGKKLRGLIDEINLGTHLNPTCSEWYVPIIGYSQAPFFFLEGTDMGKSLPLAEKTNLLYNKGYNSLDGIGRFVEEKTIDWASKRGYMKEMEIVRSELSKQLKLSSVSLEAFDVCKTKWEEAYDTRDTLSKSLIGAGKKSPDYMEIIAVMIRAAASTLTKDSKLVKDFNTGFFQIKEMSVSNMFIESGIYTKVEKNLITSQEAEAVTSLINKFRIYMTKCDEHPLRDINPILDETIKILSQLGKEYNIISLTQISDGIAVQYKKIKDQPLRDRIDQIRDIADPEQYITLLQNSLSYAEKEIGRYSHDKR